MLERNRKPLSLFTTMVIAASGSIISLPAWAQDDGEATTEVKKTTEPVFRVSKLVDEGDTRLDGTAPEETDKLDQPAARMAKAPELPAVPAKPEAAPHPLDRALDFAHESLEGMRTDVRDYTATLCKVERVNGRTSEPCYMKLKVRCPRKVSNGKESPFSIYMNFLKPNDTAGREVIWVEGKNDNKLMVHEGHGFLALKTFHLEPTSMIAMKGQRYPIYEVGIENLIVKLIEKAERDRQAGPCIVNYQDGIVINKRECRMIELVHEDRNPAYEFHRARVFIDDELNLPCRYDAYDWPTTKNGKPSLIESYTYFNIKTNVGLTDKDFDPANPSYEFPGN